MYMDRSLGGQAVSNEGDVARAQLPFEFMLNALRLREGFPLELFTERCGLPMSAIERGLKEAESRGLLECRGLPGAEWVQPTARGFDFLNDTALALLQESGASGALVPQGDGATRPGQPDLPGEQDRYLPCSPDNGRAAGRRVGWAGLSMGIASTRTPPYDRDACRSCACAWRLPD